MNPTIKNTLKTLSLFAIVILGLSAQTQAGVFVPPADGTPDFQFEPNANGIVRAIAVQSDGKILIGGDFTTLGTDDPMSTRNRIARLNADGTIDNDFAVLDVNDEVFKIAVQSDGAIVFAGDFTMVGTTTRNGIARVDTNGNLDMDFDPNLSGILANGTLLNVRALVIERDGRILIGGLFSAVGGTPRTGIARLNTSGSLNTDFNPMLNVNNVLAIAIAPDNKIAISGSFNAITTTDGINTTTTDRNQYARLNPNGTVDITFSNLTFENTINGFIDDIRSLLFQPDGKLILAGQFNAVDNGVELVTRNNVARLDVNGNLDMDFNPPSLPLGIFDVESLALQPDGKLLIGGLFGNLDEVPMTANLARLNSNGSLDTSFTPGVSSVVDAIAIQPADDNILVGGNFDSIADGLTRSNIARLENTTPPPEVNFTTTQLESSEGRTGQKAFNFDVSLSFSSNRPSSVQYTVSAGATQPSADANDFANTEFATGTLDFPVGAPTQTISVMVAGDTVTEEDETFTLTLSNPNNATLGASISAQGTIVDDEDDILCLPIPARNGNFAVVCL